MIHHLSLGSNDLDRSRAFYDPVFAVIGLRCLEQNAEGVHYGVGTFLLSLVLPVDGAPAEPGNGIHVAFAAEDRAMVDAFYETALKQGATSDGPPGLRPHYNPNYYGAFVRDPDGNKIEAVTYSAR